MKTNKILAAMAAACIAAVSSVPAAYGGIPAVPAITVSAADEDAVIGDLTFTVYEDYASLVGCSKDAEGEIAIPAEVNGVPVTSIS